MAKPSIRVAIVDDDASVRKALQRLLNVASFDVVACASGKELFKCLKIQKLHCIILDLHMPGLAGFEILRHLAQMSSESAIIIITGHDSSKMRRESLALGAKAYFAKPVDGEELIAAVRKWAATSFA
jgi:FixJ family two-component response regulator